MVDTPLYDLYGSSNRRRQDVLKSSSNSTGLDKRERRKERGKKALDLVCRYGAFRMTMKRLERESLLDTCIYIYIDRESQKEREREREREEEVQARSKPRASLRV